MILDDRTYGIQAFDTPEEAFGLMASSWSNQSTESMQILNDRQFARMIEARVITILVEAMLGKVSKEKCKESLVMSSKVNDYLLDWNYFLYSSRNQRYYTSLMEFKDDFCYLWSERQWEIYEELYQTYSFNDLIDSGVLFVKEHQHLIDEYGEDGFALILEKYWNG